MALTYRIHPAIGVARVGSSPSGWFIGPESPGSVPDQSDPDVATPANGKYKVASGEIKRQGARFRVYEYDDSSGVPVPVREITSDDATISWSVSLGNRKAAAPRIFDKGNRNAGVNNDRLIIEADGVVSGNNQAPLPLTGFFQGSHFEASPVPLGHLQTDDKGRLIVLGGFGRSFSPAGAPINDTFNNDDWCDDTSDGSVTASVTIGGATFDADSAWVIVGPTDFAPPIGNVVTLYDIVYDACLAKFGVHADPLLAMGQVSYARHVYPLLKDTANTYFVDNTAEGMFSGHGPGQGGNFLLAAMQTLLADNDSDQASQASQARNRVFTKLRMPNGQGGNMPRLRAEIDSGRLPRLADWHYAVMQQWANGNFLSDSPGPAVPLSSITIEEQPFALDKSAIQTCVGASFYPGIEAPRIFRDDPSIYRAPFRINTNLEPGALTASLAIPWQTDFYACGSGWWPAQRPNDVLRAGNREQWAAGGGTPQQFTERWKLLGFVVPDGGVNRFVEDERDI